MEVKRIYLFNKAIIVTSTKNSVFSQILLKCNSTLCIDIRLHTPKCTPASINRHALTLFEKKIYRKEKNCYKCVRIAG